MKKWKKLISATLLALTGTSPAYAAKFTGPYLVEEVFNGAASGGTRVLDNTSAAHQVIGTGSGTETVTLPDATTIPVGMTYRLTSSGTAVLTVQDDGGTTLATVNGGEAADFVLSAASDADGTWAVRIFPQLTLGAIGSTPNANGATLTGRTLNLEPASSSFGGIVTTSGQRFAGSKFFDNAIGTEEYLEFAELGSDPSTPSSGYKRLYPKDDGKLYTIDAAGTVQEVGSGSGSGTGAINYLTGDNGTFETTVGDWTAYADAAGEEPEDGVGTATITCTRSTSDPLRGDGSILITKDAADRQGEGCSVDFTLDAADTTGRQFEVCFDYEVGGSFTTGEDSDLKLFVYDKDEASLIRADENKNYILGNQGYYCATFGFPSGSDDFRLIFHTATTNASAWTFKADNFRVGPQEKVYGPAVTYLGQLTTTGSWSTNTTYTGKYWRSGDRLIADVIVSLSGAPNSADLTVNLPSGHTIDTSKLSFGTGTGTGSALPSTVNIKDNDSVDWAGLVWVESTTAIRPNKIDGSSNTGSINQASPMTFAANDSVIIHYEVPIVEFAGGTVGLAKNSFFSLGSILANGTRVTATPTKLGEYRSFSKTTSNSNTFADAAPTTGPSSSLGMRLHGAAWDDDQTSGEISLYEVYIGPGKTIEPWVTDSSGNSIGFDRYNISSATETGVMFDYDPHDPSGILIVDAGISAQTSATSRILGRRVTGGSITQVSDGYWNAIVFEKARVLGVEKPDSYCEMSTPSGHGSTNTKIRHMTVVTNYGSGCTGASDTTNGASITINESGIWEVGVFDVSSTGNLQVAISLNSSELTTNATSITNSDLVLYFEAVQGLIQGGSRVVRVDRGDVFRPHGDGTATGTTAKSRFWARKVSD